MSENSFAPVDTNEVRVIQSGQYTATKTSGNTGLIINFPLLASGKNLMLDIYILDGDVWLPTEWLIINATTGVVEEEAYGYIEDTNVVLRYKVYTTALRDTDIEKTFAFKVYQLQIAA